MRVLKEGVLGTPRLRILGIDPGLASTGWGILESKGSSFRCVDYGCIETKAGDPVSERLLFIYESIQKVIETYKPAKAAIENLYFGRNVTSAISVAEARGVLCVALAQANIPVLELRPNTVKKGVTGVISAGKAQVQEMVRIILGLRDTPRPDHAADALAMAICCAQSHELPV